MSEEVKSEEKQSNNLLVEINHEGVLGFSNQVELANAAKLIMQMKLAPDHLRKEGIEAVMSAMTLCRQYNLPVSSMNEIAVIKGKVGVFGHLMTALAQRHPKYDKLKTLYVDSEMNVISLKNKNLKSPVWAAVIQVKKLGDDEWNEYFFTEDEARTAGLLAGNVYQKYLKYMLFHRAKAMALQTEYASALKGIESAENLIFDASAERLRPVDEANKKLGLLTSDEEAEKQAEYECFIKNITDK